MKSLFMLTLCLLAINAVAQTNTVSDKVNVVYEKDIKRVHSGTPPKYYLDSVAIGQTLPIFSAEEIKDIQVKSDSKFGEVYIATKNPDLFNFMTLEEIKDKYVKSPSSATLYMVDNELIKGNMTNYKIDENYILNINVLSEEDFSSLKGELKSIDIIKITTRSKENLERAGMVYIRGDERQAGL